MTFAVLSCPQCAAPLPRVAIWRAVKCAACGSLVTKTESVVQRDSFRQSLLRSKQAAAAEVGVECGGARYRLIRDLGEGDVSKVYLAQRIGPTPFLVTIKLSSSSKSAGRYAREAEVLRELQKLGGGAAGEYFSRLLPEVVAEGAVENNPGCRALVLRHATGFWGSLAAMCERFPSGTDPRHAVWIWRRMLEMLRHLHDHAWCHGDVRPEHALVHAPDHGVRLIGWAEARKGAGTTEQAADLLRSARVVQVLLSGTGDAIPRSVPPGLAQLVIRAGEDTDYCRHHGAAGLDGILRAEALTAYGPPTFVPLNI